MNDNLKVAIILLLTGVVFFLTTSIIVDLYCHTTGYYQEGIQDSDYLKGLN